MRRYLFDTSILSDFVFFRFDVDQTTNKHRLGGALIGTCLPVVGELYYGAYRSPNASRNIKQISRRLPSFVCWPFTREAAVKYGEIAAYLKAHGKQMQQIDIQTAAIALTLGNCTIVTTDSDFDRIPELTVENWRVT